MNDIIKIKKSLEDLGIIDEVTEKVKHEIKKREGFVGALLASLATSIVQPVIYSEVKGKRGRGVGRA